MTLHLADSTIWAWARKSSELRELLAARIEAGEAATCVPVALEILHSSRNGADYEADLAQILQPLTWVPMTAEAANRAFATQRSLAQTMHGAHRMPAIDYLIAACAASAGDEVLLWHADRDLARLCEHTGQPQEQFQIRRRG